jgi:uncharacterized membrane protein YkvA (DUF1232 family)
MKRISLRRKPRPSGPRQAVRALLRELPNLFKLVFRLVRDPAVPRIDKLLFGAVALYMMTPFDLIPDFLGPLGWIDDLYLLGLALGRIVVAAGPDRLLTHWDGDPKTLGYLVEGVDELGGELPGRIRRALRGLVSDPGQLRGKKKKARKGRRPVVRRIRIDDDARVHLEE